MRQAVLGLVLATWVVGCGGGQEGEPDARPSDFFMRVLPSAGIVARPGDMVKVQVTLATPAGVGEEVLVAVDGLPPGITAEPVVVRVGTSGVLTFVIAPTVAPTTQPVESVVRAGTRLYDSASLPITIVPALGPGMLDPSFGFGGLVPLPGDIDPGPLVLDGENRLVVAGAVLLKTEVIVARFHTDGRPDESFGERGAQTISALPDMKIVPRALYASVSSELRLVTEAVVDFETRARVLRIAANGTSIDEVALEGFFTDWNDVGIDGQGRLLVAGEASQAAVARFSPAGELDRTFGDGGLVRDWPTSIDGGWLDLAMVGDDSYVVGRSFALPSDGPTIAHVSPDGVQEKIELGDGHEVCCIAVDSHRRIVVAGGSLSAIRLLDTLAVDSSFGGTWVTVPGAEASYTGAMLLLADDSVLLAAGRADFDGMLLARLGNDGQPIPIGTAQRVWLNQLQGVGAMVRLPDGDLVVAGRERSRGVLARVIMPP